MGEANQFPIWTRRKGEMEVSGSIAGPTCDSADIMYENYKYGLPLNLAIATVLLALAPVPTTTSYARWNSMASRR